METATKFNAIETIVQQGKAVVSSEDSAIVDWAFKTIAEGFTLNLSCMKRSEDGTGHRSVSRLQDSNLFQRKQLPGLNRTST